MCFLAREYVPYRDPRKNEVEDCTGKVRNRRAEVSSHHGRDERDVSRDGKPAQVEPEEEDHHDPQPKFGID